MLLLLASAVDWFVLTGVTTTHTGFGWVCVDWFMLLLLLLLTLAVDWFVLTSVTTTTYTGCGLVCADRRVILCFSRSTDIAKRWWACSCLNSSAAPIAAQTGENATSSYMFKVTTGKVTGGGRGRGKGEVR